MVLVIVVIVAVVLVITVIVVTVVNDGLFYLRLVFSSRFVAGSQT